MAGDLALLVGVVLIVLGVAYFLIERIISRKRNNGRHDRRK